MAKVPKQGLCALLLTAAAGIFLLAFQLMVQDVAPRQSRMTSVRDIIAEEIKEGIEQEDLRRQEATKRELDTEAEQLLRKRQGAVTETERLAEEANKLRKQIAEMTKQKQMEEELARMKAEEAEEVAAKASLEQQEKNEQAERLAREARAAERARKERERQIREAAEKAAADKAKEEAMRAAVMAKQEDAKKEAEKAAAQKAAEAEARLRAEEAATQHAKEEATKAEELARLKEYRLAALAKKRIELNGIPGVKLNRCYVEANIKNIRNKSIERRAQGIPLFSSIVNSPISAANKNKNATDSYWTANFELFDLTWRRNPEDPYRKARPDPQRWPKETWRCDGREAEVVGDGLSGNKKQTDGMSIRCPQQANEIVSKITVLNYTYEVRDHVNCELNHPLKKPPPGAKVVAGVIVYKHDVQAALEWIEYHHLIGYDHFYLYMMDTELDEWWPDLDYVTYVPWDLNHLMQKQIDKFLFQVGAQWDVLLRARAMSIDWVAYNDMDEYLVPRGNTTLDTYLPQFNQNDEFSSIQIQTVGFGNAPNDKKMKPWLLSHTYHGGTFGGARCKTLVRPTHVDYYNIHWVTLGEGKIYKPNPHTELWVQHYKWPQKGPFKTHKEDRIVEDTTARDKYFSVVKAKVERIISLNPNVMRMDERRVGGT